MGEVPGMDYNDTYSPVVRLESIRLILALAHAHNWEIQQMDVKGAYLNGKLKEEIYMKQPEGYDDDTGRLCRLIKTLYGLKQSGREWNEEFNLKLQTVTFTRLQSDPCVYIRKTSTTIEIITVWVDDLILVTSTIELMTKLKSQLQGMFEVTDLGDPSKIVGIELSRDRAAGTLTLTQTRYIEGVLEKYGMRDANAVKTPLDPGCKLSKAHSERDGSNQNSYATLIGHLMYASIATRPDITYAVNRLASFTSNPQLEHWTAAKRVLRYLAGTRNAGITYHANLPTPSHNTLTMYSDADFANDEDRVSISGYVSILNGGAITWYSKKQSHVALSTAEAEYSSMANAAREAIWLRNLLSELGHPQGGATTLHGDNQSALAIAKQAQYHQRSKHFDTRNHFIRDCAKNGTIDLKYCPTAEMTADIFTKALTRVKHEHHSESLGMNLA